MAITSPSTSPFGFREEIPSTKQSDDVLSWCKKITQEASDYLESCEHFELIPKTIEAISRVYCPPAGKGKLSSTSLNRTLRVFLQLSAGLTDTKPFWEFTSFNPDHQYSAKMFNMLAEEWWEQNLIDQKWLGVIQYALAGSVGYAHVRYDQDTDDIDLVPCDPRDVLPYRPANINSIQSCQAVIYREEKPMSFVVQRWPQHAAKIVVDKALNRPTQKSTVGQPTAFQSSLWGSSEPQKKIGKQAIVYLYRAYVDDRSVNESSNPVEVGDFKDTNDPVTGQDVRIPANDWSYVVQPREKLYPNKRLIVFTSTVVLYDGPSPFLHGKFPFVKFTLDPVPWSWLGISPIWGILGLQDSLNSRLRITDDHAEKVGRPDVIADKNSVSKAQLDKVDTRRSGLKVLQNPMAGKGFQKIPTDPLDPAIYTGIDFLLKQIDEAAGVVDMSQLSQLNQLPETETVEKIMESMTPAIRLRSRVLEAAIRELAYMMLSNFVQFYDVKRRFATLGPAGLTQEDFDFDPGTLIPDFSEEDSLDAAIVLAKSPAPKIQRMKTFLRNYAFQVAPSSLLNASEVTRKLLYLQLFRAGVLDPWTLLEVLGVPNVGMPPGNPKTITERLQVAQTMGFVGAVSPAGRKASGQEAPQMRPDGRITESG